MYILALFYMDINKSWPITDQLKSQPSQIQFCGVLSEHKSILYIIVINLASSC